MVHEISVRAATAADLAFVTQDGYVPAAIVARKIAEGEVFVAAAAGRPVGYARLEHLWSHVPYLALIWVLPDHRRQGAGAALLASIGAGLSAGGHGWLYSSSQADEPAPQAWHRRHGFEECGLIAGINGGVGELFFRKRLAAAQS